MRSKGLRPITCVPSKAATIAQLTAARAEVEHPDISQGLINAPSNPFMACKLLVYKIKLDNYHIYM